MNANPQHLRSHPYPKRLDPFRPLVDRFGRFHNSLRVSVTDVCNLRCLYCMPEQNVRYLADNWLLSFGAIERLVRVMAKSGIRKVRLTGGEPLVRRNLKDLVSRLSKMDGIEDIALTTNGMFLADQIEGLVAAGLTRVNISLDSLSDETFKRLTRRDGLEHVLKGIDATVQISRLQTDAGVQPA